VTERTQLAGLELCACELRERAEAEVFRASAPIHTFKSLPTPAAHS
jgi:hypothetical protein